MKAIIISRVSDPKQEEAGNSLPAQEARQEKYFKSKGYEVLKAFRFDESAYKSKHRDEFDEIIEFICAQKDKVAVGFDKVDRLSRDVFDKRVSLLYEKALKDEIEIHFASDNQIINSHISAVEKFQFSISLGLAKYYSDAISDNVKRAIEQKLRRGEFPGRAPCGYKNVDLEDDKKWIEPDLERADLVIKLFEWYAVGDCSMDLLRIRAKNEGLTNYSSGNYLSKSQIEHILKNPFYYGVMRYNFKLYPHSYKPLISKELFDKVQQVRLNWKKKRFKYAAKPFAYRGLFNCVHCGCLITFEFKKGKYVYGHCTNYFKNCPNVVWIREEVITSQIEELLKDMTISTNVLEELVKELKSNHKLKIAYHERTMVSLKAEYDKIENRLDKIYEDLLDESITKETYDRLLLKYKKIQDDILTQMQQHSEADENYYIEAGKLLELANKAYDLFKSSEDEEKRELLQYLLQNSKMDGKKVVPGLKMPFDAILIANKTQNWLPG